MPQNSIAVIRPYKWEGRWVLRLQLPNHSPSCLHLHLILLLMPFPFDNSYARLPDAVEQRGQDSLFHSSASKWIWNLPRGRIEDPRPSLFAVDPTQVGSPNGRPRCAEVRNASRIEGNPVSQITALPLESTRCFYAFADSTHTFQHGRQTQVGAVD